MRTAVILILCLAAACGGDELGLDDGSLEVDANFEVDAAVPVDAGKDATGLPTADAGQQDAGRTFEIIDGPATCTGGTTSGAGALSSRCLTAAELAGGCKVAVRPTGDGGTEVLADRGLLERATYAVFHAGNTMLCTGAPPTINWLCGNVPIGACRNVNDQSTCSLSYLLEPLPQQVVSCQ